MFVNDELLYVTDMRLSQDVLSTIECIYFNSLIAADGVSYLDNISFVESKTPYDGTPLTEGFAAGSVSKN